MRKGTLLLLVCLLCFALTGKAQEIVTEAADSIQVVSTDTIPGDIPAEAIPVMPDTIAVPAAVPAETDSTVRVVILKADSLGVPKVDMEPSFHPNPTTATLYALIPGMGQIYNRKYWKLPLVYGGFMGFFYAITWNNRNYQDYKQAYFDLLSEDPKTNDSWRDFVRTPNLSKEEEDKQYIGNSSFENELKSKKDYFRRYRDLSIILAVGFYAITIIDAYVDAQLFDFDITPDLSMRIEPAFSPKTSVTSRTYGLNCSLTF